MKSLSRAFISLLLTLGCGIACSSGDPPKTTTPSVCHADSECGSGHCDPKSGCVACLFDRHCGDGKRCAAGVCYAPTSCDADKDCGAEAFPVCDPAVHECVRCLRDEQCGDSARCSGGACKPFEKCAAEKDCSGGLHCDLGSGECVSCLTRGDCGVGSDCVQGECRVACKAEADCAASGNHCTVGGHCGECADDTQCAAVYHCQAGTCVRDTCEQGTAACSADGAAVATCSANGDAQMMSACAAGQSCAVDGSLAQCKPWTCSPSAARCAADGVSVETCAADGLSIEKTEACGKDEQCVAGRCVTLSCEPNAAFCKDGASYTCSPNGTESVLNRACTENEHCDLGTGKCAHNSCTPGTTTCNELSVGTCRADGSGYDYSACGAAQTCADGKCYDVVCAASTSFCADNKVMVCNATGTASSVFSNCQGSCVTSGSAAYCAVLSCTPGSPVCDGSAATVCKPDGSGPDPDGVDCASVDAYCDAGQCKPLLCKPNARVCQGEYMYQCSADGRSLNEYSYYACTSYYWSYSHCNPSTGQCQAQACTPSTKFCSSNVAHQCDATGYVDSVVEDCTTSGKICSQGSCVAKVCEPDAYFCKDGNAYYCDAGTTAVLNYTCSAAQYCNNGYCYSDVCTAGKPVCNGNAVSTCAADGSGPVGAGTACGANKACVNGACVPVTCTANALLCAGGHVQQCNSTGTAASLYQYCVSETYCDQATTSCKADVCPQSKPYCEGEALKTCKADGSGAVNAGTLCSASSKVCTPAGCVATAVEPLGTTGQNTSLYGSDYMYGDIIKVSQARKLTKIEMDLSLSGGPISAHWLVYSSVDGVTFYQTSDTAASLANTADAWVGSSALSVTLDAGLYYWIGLELQAAPSGYINFHVDDLSTPALSFAQVLGSSTRSAAGPPASFTPSKTTSLYYLRLSTALP